MYMVCEYMSCGDLYNFIHESAEPLDQRLLIQIAIDVAEGMQFLHNTTPPILHRDLKSPNILLASKTMAKVVAKVADFGLSSLSVHRMQGRDVLNPNWLAPEIINEEEYSDKADVYSYGIVLWELVTRQLPFEEYQYRFTYQLEDAIVKQQLRPTIPETCPEDFAKLIRDCWSADQSARPSFTDVIQRLQAFRESLFGIETLEAVPSEESVVEVQNAHDVEIAPLMTDRNHLGSRIKADAKRKLVYHKCYPTSEDGVFRLLMVDDTLICGCNRGAILIWNTLENKMIARLHTNDSHTTPINSLIYLKETGHLWSSAQDSHLCVWNMKDYKLVKKVSLHHPITCLLEVGKFVWCGSADSTLQLRAKESKKKFKVKKTVGVPEMLSCMYFDAESGMVWAGSSKKIILYNSKTCDMTRALSGHTDNIHSIIPVDQNIWSCSSDRTIRVWSREGAALRTLEGHMHRVFALLYFDGLVWSASWDTTIMIWDPNTFQFHDVGKGSQKDAISDLVPVTKNNNKYVWSASWDGSLCIWSSDR
eukprot:TRINITY_DN7157_c0_g2_i2.p1 TRINITY_DN7157_c0_g2~~TRINITY_DN7157_c0_g2_i2.p1  ORF type:complete len:620 (-),score=130.31 TRINITY_DN7157_c0_g2_i2:21-1622(-)